jgi:hypothetical protein
VSETETKLGKVGTYRFLSADADSDPKDRNRNFRKAAFEIRSRHQGDWVREGMPKRDAA